jgi:hypothetical protein
MEKIGFKFYKKIKREVPSKILPSTRDKTTGRFTSTMKADRLAYKVEYIVGVVKI